MNVKVLNVILLIYILQFSKVVNGYINCLPPKASDTTNCSCANITGNGNSNPNVILGSSVTLNCIISAETDKVQWSKGLTSLGNDGSIDPAYTRYSMKHEQANDYSLTIVNISIEDEDTFTCQLVGCGNKLLQYALTYWAIPEGPYIDNECNSIVAVVENEVTKLTCHAYNAKPVATVTWYISNPDGKQDMYSSPSDQLGMYNTTATYTFTPSRTQDGDSFICAITNEAVKESGTPLSKTVTISVYVQPTIPDIAEVQGGTLTLSENQQVNVTCEALNAYPRPTIIWYRDFLRLETISTVQSTNSTSVVNVTSILEIDGIAANDGVNYSCVIETQEPLTNVSKSFVVNVPYQISAGAIAGAVVGTVVGIILIIILIYCICKRNQKKVLHVDEDREDPKITFEQKVEDDEVPNKPVGNDKVESEVIAVTETNQELGDAAPTTELTTTEPFDDQESSDEFSDYASILPPNGDTFSITSSMQRSDRGSPIHMYSDLDELSVDSSVHTNIKTVSGSLQYFHVSTKNPLMISDV